MENFLVFLRLFLRYFRTYFVSLLLPIAAVFVGVFAFTVVRSIMGGMVRDMKMRALAVESHVEITSTNPSGFIDADFELLEVIKKSSPEIVHIMSHVRMNAILQAGNRMSIVNLLGIYPEDWKYFSRFLHKKNVSIVHEPQYPRRETQVQGPFPSILAGRSLLYHMRTDVGSRLTLVSTFEDDGPGGMVNRQIPVVVADSFVTFQPMIDAKWVIVSMETLQSLYDIGNVWNVIALRIKNPLDSDFVATRLNHTLQSYNLVARSWNEQNQVLVKALKLERIGMALVMGMVVLVGSVSITITFLLTVRKKTREMAIMRALGITRKNLGMIYLCLGSSVGIIGAVGGTLLGIAALVLLNKVPLPYLSAAFGGGTFPVEWDIPAYVIFGLVSILMAAFASVWPAREVMQIDIVQAIGERPE